MEVLIFISGTFLFAIGIAMDKYFGRVPVYCATASKRIIASFEEEKQETPTRHLITP